ncbi:MAG: ABC transporter ATP-binding protein [Xanthomonadales bacterium]|nr:ABC transporter ATP-binding protein [Xanthomonadales bacterium]
MTELALSIRGLRKTYDNGVTALAGIDLDVAAGDFFALLGPNGAGKSTTIGIVTSLVNRSGGSVRIFDHDLGSEREAALSCVGVVPQEINFNQFEKPFDIVSNQAGFYGLPRKLARERAEKYLRQLSLWDKAQVAARTLSGGMKRRLMIARAMVHEPRLLILDEPTAGVDIEIRRSMWNFVQGINAAGTTVILTTHYLEEAESLCRNIAIIDRGRIVEHTSMKALLAKLDRETFVLDLVDSMDAAPTMSGAVQLRRIDATTLEADVPRDTTLNELFAELDRGGIRVRSLRNKANRLEELFLGLVERGNGGAR